MADIDTIWTELILADLEVLERRIDKVHTAAKAKPREYAAEIHWLEGLRAHLEGGQRARTFVSSDQEREWAALMALLTTKPYLYVANVNESELPAGGSLARRVRDLATQEHVQAVVLCAQTEMDLLEWDERDAVDYRADLGCEESGLQQLVRASYALLGLITFFTATGTKTVQAWAIPAGTRAPQAAGQIHSDMERGFIRAEVVSFEDLHRHGSFAAVKEHGLQRIEGRDYAIADGDIVHFRFNV
jgi:GTP-binding protein YchF